MAIKKFYWLKMHKDFFKSIEMKKLRRVAGGDTYTIIYLKLQLLSLENDGHLFFEGIDDNFCSELALEIDEDSINVETTFTFLLKVGLLEMVTDDELKLPHVVDNIGCETPSASRKRRQRSIQNQQLTEENVTLSQGCHSDVTTESQKSHDRVKSLELRDRDRDKSKDIKDNTTPNPSKGNSTKFVKPTIEEIDSYAKEKVYKIDSEYLWNYYEAKGWMVGKNKMKNWRSAVTNWSKNSFNNNSQPKSANHELHDQYSQLGF